MNEKSIQQKSTFWITILIIVAATVELHFGNVSSEIWVAAVGLGGTAYLGRESLRDRAKPNGVPDVEKT